MRNCVLPRRTGVLFAITLLCIFVSVASAQFTGVTTYHNDMARTGLNPNESILTPSNVSVATFGRVWAYPLDGPTWAQPLYLPNVVIPGHGPHNVVYVVTEQDGVYAFDADGKMSAPIWYVSLINPSSGITAVPCTQMAQSCNVFPNDGITATPVIDTASQTMYLVAQTLENGVFYQRLHAIDITTGAEKFGGPTIIQGSVQNKKGTLVFDPQHNLPRQGLLLLNGVVYITWAGSTHGWMMAYDATTLTQKAIICTTPNGSLGGLWSSGGGIMSDGTYVYDESGDGTFSLNTAGSDWGDAIVKLDPTTLAVLDYFSPMDQICRKLNDIDLGSGGPMLLTNQPGPFPNEIIVSGKGGNPCDGTAPNYEAPVYMVNKDNLGGYNATMDLDIQTILGAPFGYHSSPAFFQGATSGNIYLAGLSSEGGTGDYLKQYSLINGVLSSTAVAQSGTVYVIGATPSVSSNGTSNGIVWAQARHDLLSSTANIKPSTLYAYDATNVANTFYSSDQGGTRDQAGPATKFVTPTIAKGRVYLGTLTELDVYGLLAGQTATTTTMSTSANPVYGSPITLSATVTSSNGTPTGSVDFFMKDGYNQVGVGKMTSGKGSISLTGLLPGSHIYDATYDGAATFGISSSTITFAVNKAPTTTVINSSSLNPSVYGQPVTFTATVTSNNPAAGVPTGTVTFKKGSGALGTGTLNASGVATYTTTPTQLTGGNDSITAQYTQDTLHANSVSAAFTQTVTPQATSTAFTASPNPANAGQTVTLTATVTAAVGVPAGNVVFKNGATTLATVALVNGVATYQTTFTHGSYSLKAAFQGNTNNQPSSQTITLTVN